MKNGKTASSSSKQHSFKKKIYKKKKELRGKKKSLPLDGNEELQKKEPHKKESTKIEPPRKLSSNWQAFLEGEKKDQTKRKETPLHKKHKQDGQKDPARKRKFKNRIKSVEAEKKATETIDQKDIWFDDVDIEDIENATGKKIKLSETPELALKQGIAGNTNGNTTEDGSTQRVTKYLAIDCEMVGVGIDGKDNMLARVSLVNSFGETVYDEFVAPMQKVVDYRTEVSGVRPEDLKGAPEFTKVQQEVANLTKDKILIGHSINNDLKVLLLSHPRKNIRDTSTYKPFKELLKTKYPSLKKLVKEVLQIDIQSGEHSSVEDARCTMKVFLLHRKHWEKSLKEKGVKQTISTTPKIFMGKNGSLTQRKRKYLEQKRRKKGK